MIVRFKSAPDSSFTWYQRFYIVKLGQKTNGKKTPYINQNLATFSNSRQIFSELSCTYFKMYIKIFKILEIFCWKRFTKSQEKTMIFLLKLDHFLCVSLYMYVNRKEVFSASIKYSYIEWHKWISPYFNKHNLKSFSLFHQDL